MWLRLVWHILVIVAFLGLIPLYAYKWWHGEPADWYIWFMAAWGGIYLLGDSIEKSLDAIIKLKER